MPGAAFLTIFGGLVFGTIVAGLATVVGATGGAIVIFLIAKSAVGDWLAQRAGPRLEKIAAGFRAYQRLMEHWRRVLPVPVLEVDYEETVADLEGVAHRLVAWCGLEWEPACLSYHEGRRPVRTAPPTWRRRGAAAAVFGG